MGIESPIFSKCFDLLLWITTHTEKFPKNERFRLAKRIEESAFNMHILFLRAVYPKHKSGDWNGTRNSVALSYLEEADIELKKIQFYFRLANKKHLTSMNQYEYISTNLMEIGKLLGGWIKKVQ